MSTAWIEISFVISFFFVSVSLDRNQNCWLCPCFLRLRIGDLMVWGFGRG